jgi:hypothetical protein
MGVSLGSYRKVAGGRIGVAADTIAASADGEQAASANLRAAFGAIVSNQFLRFTFASSALRV